MPTERSRTTAPIAKSTLFTPKASPALPVTGAIRLNPAKAMKLRDITRPMYATSVTRAVTAPFSA